MFLIAKDITDGSGIDAGSLTEEEMADLTNGSTRSSAGADVGLAARRGQFSPVEEVPAADETRPPKLCLERRFRHGRSDS